MSNRATIWYMDHVKSANHLVHGWRYSDQISSSSETSLQFRIFNLCFMAYLWVDNVMNLTVNGATKNMHTFNIFFNLI